MSIHSLHNLKQLNRQRAAMLKVGLGGRAIDKFEVGAGARRRYGRGGVVGATHSSAYTAGGSSCPPNTPGPGQVPTFPGAGLDGNCPEVVPRCECQLLAQNSLGATPGAVVAGTTVTYAVDSGDIALFQAFEMNLIAFPASATDDELTSDCTPCPVLLTASRTGNTDNMRKTGTIQDGIASDLIGVEHPMTCLDWLPWTSQNNMTLSLDMFGVNNANVHFFTLFTGSAVHAG